MERGLGLAEINTRVDQTDEVASVYSGYTPLSFLRKPTPSILRGLPPLALLDRSVLCPLDDFQEEE